MITVEQITPAQREAVLCLQEGHFHELKAIDAAPSRLIDTISAFANSAGGELYIGIREDEASDGSKTRLWQGFKDVEAANGHLQAIGDVIPLGTTVTATFLQVPGTEGLVLKLDVFKTRDICPASRGKIYRRRGAQNIPVKSAEERRQLEMDKGLVSFETEPVNVALAFVTKSDTLSEFIKTVVPQSTPEHFVRKQLLVHRDMPVVAAVLLFADVPQSALPKRSAIKIYRYKTTEMEGTRETLADDPLTIEGCLYAQIASAVQTTVRMVERVQVMGSTGLLSIEYPRETLHEIITNAVLHRDYSIPSDIHIRVFDNRVEVESPGRLPGHVTPANILGAQFARNGAIVRLINKFPNPPNKDVGEGLNTAFSAMRALRLKDPIIEEREQAVVVNIRHERLASPEEAILAHLETHTRIRNREARTITGINSENKVKEVFYRLRDAGKIERVPKLEGSASAWRKTVSKKKPAG